MKIMKFMISLIFIVKEQSFNKLPKIFRYKNAPGQIDPVGQNSL